MNVLDEGYERLLATGPEFDGWLSNHGPMVVEALAHHGSDHEIHRWIDWYERRLEPRPPGRAAIDDWREALGDPGRLGDWLDLLDREVAEEPWADVLARWWPRLLPGIAAGATHGVIRVGHAVRALQQLDTEVRRRELGAGLAYWAARWQPVASEVPSGGLRAADALADIPLVPDRSGGVDRRLAQLTTTDGWLDAVGAIAPARTPAAAADRLRDLVTAAAHRYLTHGHGNGVMLVHSVTAPTAVLRALPALPEELWIPSADAAWTASAALVAAYGARRPWSGAPAAIGADLFAAAVDHRDEHVVKLADSVLDVHAWTGDDRALAAGARALDLIAADVAA